MQTFNTEPIPSRFSHTTASADTNLGDVEAHGAELQNTNANFCLEQKAGLPVTGTLGVYNKIN